MYDVLVTGCNGQLGSEIKILSSKYKKYNFVFIDIEELDLTDTNAVNIFFAKNKFDFIINCAAYTAVDKAEKESKIAESINAAAAKYLAQISAKYNSFLIHISTDYVFDGKNYKPYVETDTSNPTSVYGKTKLEGENNVITFAKKAIIIRTSWLYSEFGNNFVKTMLKYGKERDHLNVVFDQIGTPTYAKDLANAILEIIPKTNSLKNIEIYHYSNEGAVSWYDFAKEIMKLSNIDCKINPIETKDYPLPTPRPFYSVLNKSKIKKYFNIEIPYWKDSLKICINNLIS